jgi:hypothetical protein
MACVDETTTRVGFVNAPVTCRMETAKEGLASAAPLKDLTWPQWVSRRQRQLGYWLAQETAMQPADRVSNGHRVSDHRSSLYAREGYGAWINPRRPRPRRTPARSVHANDDLTTPRIRTAKARSIDGTDGMGEPRSSLEAQGRRERAVSEAAAAEEHGTPCNLPGTAAAGSVKAQAETEPGAG